MNACGTMERIYLDNAATSWPKPPEVYQAVDRYFRELGAPAGRSAYAEAAEVEAAIVRARAAIARLIGAENPQQVVFAFNGTDALNMAIHGLLRPAGHVIATDAEHNSVLRPLRLHADRHAVEVSYIPCDGRGVVDPDDVRRAIRPDTQLIALTHASNVTGALQPAAAIGQLAHDHGIAYLLDAAQTLGDIPLNVRELQVDLLAAPGHKGLLGPLGTGILYLRPGLEERLIPLRQGGTGTRSEEESQPAHLPDRYESGNHNVPGLVGLEAAVAWLAAQRIEQLRQHQQELTAMLLASLADLPNITLYGPESAESRVGVVSLNVAGYDPQELAGGLDAAYRIQTRAGLHCAPRMHRSLGTLDLGGTLRVSIGPFNTADHIEQLLAALREL